jgi:tetratricopeptide (TPR) repeat protein
VGDVAFVSLGNILHRTGRYDDALETLTHALQINRTTVMVHFAMANVFASRGDWASAERFYLSTLFYQPRFRPAKMALVTVQCRKMEETRKRKKKGRDSNRGVRAGKNGLGKKNSPVDEKNNRNR